MSTIEQNSIKWMEEPIKKVPFNKWLFKILCFFMRKQLTYKDLYIFYTNVYNKTENYKMKAMNNVINIYEYNKNI